MICLRYSQEQLYAVVAGVEHYKEFVPWCQRSDIVDKKPPGFVEAELEVGFKMFVERSVMVLSSHSIAQYPDHKHSCFSHDDPLQLCLA